MYIEAILLKKWELLVSGKSTKIPPEALDFIERNDKLNLLGVTFAENSTNWGTHFE